jgi:hypothetical protein
LSTSIIICWVMFQASLDHGLVWPGGAGGTGTARYTHAGTITSSKVMLVAAAGVFQVGDEFADRNFDAAGNSHRLALFGA